MFKLFIVVALAAVAIAEPGVPFGGAYSLGYAAPAATTYTAGVAGVSPVYKTSAYSAPAGVYGAAYSAPASIYGAAAYSAGVAPAAYGAHYNPYPYVAAKYY